jgi:hypothetical protein
MSTPPWLGEIEVLTVYAVSARYETAVPEEDEGLDTAAVLVLIERVRGWVEEQLPILPDGNLPS